MADPKKSEPLILTDEERLAAWRAERAKVAEEGRAERLRQADEDRRKRMEAFEEDKERRVEEAARKREEAAAQAEAERLEKAAERLDTLEDLETARARLNQRRRRGNLTLAARFVVLVLLPTCLALWYYTQVATPIYGSRAIFAVQTLGNDPATEDRLQASAASNRDAFIARAYITSPDLMELMAEEHGFIAHFDGARDSITAWAMTAAGETRPAMDTYLRHVQVGLDIQEGLLTLSISARTAEDAARFSDIILDYTQAHINELAGNRQRRQLSDIATEVALASEKLGATRRKLADLQIETGEIDPASRAASIYGLVADLERELTSERRSLEDQIARSGATNAVVQHSKKKIFQLEQSIADQRAILVSDAGDHSVNRQIAEFEYAKVDIDLARRDWESKLGALEALRLKIAQSERYIARISQPTRPLLPGYPDPVSGSLVVFLIALAGFMILNVFWASITMHARR